jgi:hypothetical protein
LKEKRGKLYVFFVDFSSAFDSINRDFLIYKLSQIGVSLKLINFIRNLYSFTKINVLTPHGLCNSFETKNGVRQGCPLSPLLFTLFINDLPSNFVEGGITINNQLINSLLFADDLALIAKSREALIVMINQLASYVSRWGLNVNLQKSKIIVFRKGGHLSKLDKFYYNNTEVEIVKNYTYLGILFQYTGNFNNHFKSRAISARTGIFAIWRLFASNTSTIAKFKVFDAIYKAILLYAAQVWGHIKNDDLEAVQRLFIKKVFNLPYNTPNYILLLECGRHSIFLSALRLHLKYLVRVSKLNDERYTKCCFINGIENEIGWFHSLKMLCNTAGLNPIFISSNSIDQKLIGCSNLIFRLLEQEKQLLFSDSDSAQFHPFYRNIKQDFLSEDYLNNITIPFDQVKLIFAARAEMLPVKYKPWLNGNCRDDKCLFCSNNEQDTVFHVLFICPEFSSTRCKFFGKLTINREEGISILKGEKGFNCLGRYLKEVFRFRKYYFSGGLFG